MLFYTAEGFLFSLGRKTKNKFEDSSIALEKGTEFRLFDLALPSWTKITYRPMIDGQLSIAIGSEDVALPFSQKDEMIKKINALGHQVIEIKPSIMRVTDECPVCHRRGIPKIERKDAHDRRTRRPTHLGDIEKNKIYSKRAYEHWLTYDHKTRPKKCRVYQLESLESSKIKPSKTKIIKMEEFVFPYAIHYLKEKLLGKESSKS